MQPVVAQPPNKFASNFGDEDSIFPTMQPVKKEEGSKIMGNFGISKPRAAHEAKQKTKDPLKVLTQMNVTGFGKDGEAVFGNIDQPTMMESHERNLFVESSRQEELSVVSERSEVQQSSSNQSNFGSAQQETVHSQPDDDSIDSRYPQSEIDIEHQQPQYSFRAIRQAVFNSMPQAIGPVILKPREMQILMRQQVDEADEVDEGVEDEKTGVDITGDSGFDTVMQMAKEVYGAGFDEVVGKDPFAFDFEKKVEEKPEPLPQFRSRRFDRKKKLSKCDDKA